ncbi:hypothetical protein ABZ816_18130 [Actinosynnema sp. NPDC047251]|uniref:hypothetical protein n=1 Tax=Saccharothrix espanaensis TaxID=103731 RepID=UPI00130E2727|nr:hypothetical protein [Saccharothrix espanaensis]
MDERGEAVGVAALSPAELPSRVLKLTGIPLSELRDLREPSFQQAVRRTECLVRAGAHGVAVQVQRD